MRSMVLEYQNDPSCCYLDRQYMLGDSLLVAPIFNDQGMAEYYLPAGRWTNYLTGQEAAGGCWRREQHGYLSIPLLVRENTIVPTTTRTDSADASYAEHLLLKVYCLQEQAQTQVWQGQEKVLDITVQKNGNDVVVHSQSKHEYKLQFVNCTIVRADGVQGEVVREGADSIVTIADETQEIKIRL